MMGLQRTASTNSSKPCLSKFGTFILARGANFTNVHLSRLVAGVQKAGLDIHDVSLASGSAYVLGFEVSPSSAHCSGTGKTEITNSLSRPDGLFTPSHERAGNGARQWSRISLGAQQSWALSQSLMQASSSRGRLTWYQGNHGQPCARNGEHLVESSVFSVVIGVFTGSTSASLRMHRKRASHSRFLKDAASRRRKLVESQNGQGSREAPGPSVPGRVCFATSRQMSIWVARVPTRM